MSILKKDSVVNGYRLTQDFELKGGQSRVTFVQKNGIEFFMKEFLWPTFPFNETLFSDDTIKMMKQDCHKFEAHHQNIVDALKKRVATGGNLIITLDFFRNNAKYYKITERVKISSTKANEIHRLALKQVKIILKTVLNSLQVLHNQEILHGDIKPDNILIKKTSTGDFTTKLIDFDNAFFVGKAPDPKFIVGTPEYFSPELENAILGKISPQKITTKSDIFTLGIVFSQYITGDLPHPQKKGQNYCTLCNNGEKIEAKSSGDTNSALIEVCNRMLDKDPKKRPSILEIKNIIDGCDSTAKKTPVHEKKPTKALPSEPVRLNWKCEKCGKEYSYKPMKCLVKDCGGTVKKPTKPLERRVEIETKPTPPRKNNWICNDCGKTYIYKPMYCSECKGNIKKRF